MLKVKLCSGSCNSEKLLSLFGNNKAKKDGKQSYCKSCQHEYRRITKQNTIAYSKKYYQAHKVDKLASTKLWQRNN